MRVSKRVSIILLSFVGLIIVLHIVLPLLVKNYLNDKLSDLKDYRGHVESVYLEIFRGAFRIHGFKLEKLDGKVAVPFVDIPIVDFSLSWHELFHKKVVAKMGFIDPNINIVDGPTQATSQTKVSKSTQEVLKDLIPVKLDLFWIRNGQIHFRNFESKPPVDIYMDQVKVIATNLTNTSEKGKELFGHLTFDSKIMKTGHLHLDSKLDPLADPATVDAKAEVKDVRLIDLNAFFLAYGKFDVTAGVLDVAAEMTTYKGKLEGYIKPFMHETVVLGSFKERDQKQKVEAALGAPKPNPIWETLVAAVLAIFKNHPNNMQAAKIPFHGDLKNVKVDIWPSIWSFVKNAFIAPEKPGIEYSESLPKLKAEMKK